MDGKYEPIAIEMLDDRRLRGHSEALGLYVCWEDGELLFYDPVTESYLHTHAEDANRAEEERADRLADEARAEIAEAHSEEERASRVAAEAHLEELETELRRLRGE